MPNKPIVMNKLRQVLRLSSQGKGTKSISNILKVSRTTVKKYLSRFKDCGIEINEVLSLNDKDLCDLFQDKEVSPLNEHILELEKLLPVYCKRLKRKGVTREMLYGEYKEKHAGSYSRSSFCYYLRQYEFRNNIVMYLQHKAGDKLFINFVGKKLHITHPDTGEITHVEVFVAILSCSRLTYVEAVHSQKKEDLILACEPILHYIEGVPVVIYRIIFEPQ